MPNRILKESVCTSDTIARLTDFQECLFYRLIVTVDDYGRYDARPAILKGKVFPLKDVCAEQITAALDALALAGLVRLYMVDGRPFMQLSSWKTHQRPPRCIAKYPAPPDMPNTVEEADARWRTSAGNCPQAAADCGLYPESGIHDPVSGNQNPESNKTGDKPVKRARFTPPSAEEVGAYCRERGNGIDARRFIDHYTANGWMAGKVKMQDWKAAVRTWERNGRERGESNGPGTHRANNAGFHGNDPPESSAGVHADLPGIQRC